MDYRQAALAQVRLTYGGARIFGVDPRPVARIDDDNPYVRQVREQKQQDAAWRLASDKRKPDDIANANRLARARQIPAPLVDGNVEAFQTQKEAADFLRLMRENERVRQWATENERRLPLARDDVEAIRRVSAALSLEGMEKRQFLTAAPRRDPTFWNSVLGVWDSLVGGTAQAKAGTELAFADWVSLPGTTEADRRRFKKDRLREVERQMYRVQDASPDFRSSTASGLYSGVSSLAQMAPGVALSVALRNPAPALATAGVQTTTQAYGKYRVRGAGRGEALLGAGLEGATEVATERLGMGFLVDRLGKIGAGKLVSGFVGREMAGEQVATIVQDAVDTAIANPEKTWAEYIAERPDAAYQTALATLVSGGAIAGVSVLGHGAAARRERAARVTAETLIRDGFADGAKASKLRSRDPVEFAALVDKLTDGTGVDNIYIPAAAVQEYLQSDFYSGESYWSDWGSQIEEGSMTGGDIVIPTGEAMAKIAGTPAWDALKDHMRFSPGGVSQAELATYDSEDAAFDRDLSSLMEDTAVDPARGAVFQDVYDKLTNAGFTPATARVQAELVTQRYAARAERMGRALTGQEFADVAVRQVLPEGLARARRADAVDIAINAYLRDARGGERSRGPSLLEFLASRGGIDDTGGDFTAMGADKWHRGKKFRRKLVRSRGKGNAEMFAGASRDNTPDALFEAARAAGYFPELAREGDTSFADKPDLAAFHSAVEAELRGNPVYADAGTSDVSRDWVDGVAEIIARMGLDTNGLSVDQVRAAIDQYEAAQPTEFFQGNENDPRGSIQFPAQWGRDRAIINIFAKRNLSTFLHETGHLWLEELKADATSPDAPEDVRRDWETIRDWFAANGHDVAGGNIPVDAHELWARGFERYLMEGNAPVPSLRGIFEKIRTWMINQYRRVDNLMAPITAEVREVMDRLVATDAEIEASRLAQELEPIFQDPAEAGMTAPEFAAYRSLVDSARGEAQTQLLQKNLSAIKARETRRWKQQADALRPDIAAAVDNRPEFRAARAIRQAPLNSQWIVDRYGRDALAMMPKGVPPSHRADGADPNAVAEMAGLSSAAELVELAMGLEARRREMKAAGDKRTVRDATVEQEVDAEMRRRHGDPLTDGSIEDEALAAVHNDIEGEVLAAEVRALGRRLGVKPTPYSVARSWARGKVRAGSVRDHLTRSAIQQYKRQAARNGKQAFDALAAGRHDEAFRFKQAQMVSNALAREAVEAFDEVQTAVKRLEKVAGARARKSVDQDYWDQARALIEAVDLSPRTAKSVSRQVSFENWAKDREAEGFDVVVPSSFAATIGRTHWTRLTAEELLGLDAAVTQVLHIGRTKKTLLDNQQEREFDAVVGEALKSVERLPQREPPKMTDATWYDGIKKFALESHAALLKMETVFTRLDGSKDGAFHRIVFRPIAEAQAREKTMLRQYLEELKGHVAKVPKAQLAQWRDIVELPSLIDPETGGPVRIERSKLISMALNMGNASNAQKLAGGYRWPENVVLDTLNNQLSAEEWRYVQATWDTIEKLWPDIAALEKRINGFAPDKIEARPVSTPAGMLRGGYFPVIYDPSRNYRTEELASVSTDKLFENSYTRATTSKGFTKARVEVERPIHLSLDVINRHVGEVIHDLTHREAIMQADQFLSDRRIMKAVDETMGAPVRQLFRPWLQHIANEWAVDRAAISDFDKALRGLRRNATFVGMGYRMSTMMMQAAGYASSFERVGARWVGPAIGNFIRSPRQTTEFVLEKSFEVRDRLDTLDRDIRENIRSVTGQRDIAADIRRFAFTGIGYMDRLVVIPTWIAEYTKSIAHGVDDRTAIHRADSAVRESQGSGAAKDLAKVQRGTGRSGAAMQLATMFYSFQSSQYQRFVTLGWDAGDAARAGQLPQRFPELLARSWWMIAVAPIAAALLAGRGPEDDETAAGWALEQSLFNAFGPLPFVRDAGPVVYSRATGGDTFGYRFTPAQGAFEALDRVAADYQRVNQGKETKRATRNTLEAAGYLTGLVPGQFAATSQFAVDWMTGDADPETAGEWWNGITKGRTEG